jgi:GAF domain-containing protein
MIQVFNQQVSIPPDLEKKVAELLIEAMKKDDADKCTLQIYDKKNDVLRIIAQSGFSEEFLEHFETVRPFDGSSCGRALGVGSPIIISDFAKDIAFAPHRQQAKKEGISAVISVPIFGDNNQKLGVLSTHFAEPKWTWNLDKINTVVYKLAPILSLLRSKSEQIMAD